MRKGRKRTGLDMAALLATLAFMLTGCHQSGQDFTLPGTTQPRYEITDIGPAQDLDINNKDQIVGTYEAGIVPNGDYRSHAPRLITRGFLWENGKRTEMRTFGGWTSGANVITDQGQVIGYADVPGAPKSASIAHRCFWDGTNLMDLEADPRFHAASETSFGAIHMTASGTVYVVSPPPGSKGPQHLWLYPSGFWPGIGHDKGVIGGSRFTVSAINDHGMVIGNCDTGKRKGAQFPDHHGFVWWQGKMTELGTFGGNMSDAAALNNNGQVVGFAGTKINLTDDILQYPSHAFLWEKGKIHDLGTLPGGNSSTATGINDKGQIIGTSNGPGQEFTSIHPVLWENGQVQDLTRLIPTHTKWSWLDKPTGINDNGQIVGDGDIQNGKPGPITVIAGGAGDGYLLTPLKQ